MHNGGVNILRGIFPSIFLDYSAQTMHADNISIAKIGVMIDALGTADRPIPESSMQSDSITAVSSLQ